MNAPASLTINFDSNIISITGPSNMSGTITTSGESLGGSAADGMGYKFTVALQDGYIIDSISTELNEYCGYLDRFGADYFWIVAESGGINGTITITSKLAVSRKSVDLTTLPGWSSLSDGSHSITIVAKADGYRDSEPSAAVRVEKGSAMPSKGDIITMDSRQYRVLTITGNIAEVLAMYNSTTSQAFDTSGSSKVYANSSLDVYLSQTFYNSLSTTMQNAVVAKTFQQDSWYYGSNSSAIAKYNGTYQTANNYTLSLMSTTFGASISRKCYVLSCQDVIDYLEVTTSMGSADTTLTSENVWRMFWNQTTSPGSTYPWLRSASSGNSSLAFCVRGSNGDLVGNFVDSTRTVRPAFQIDLSKVEFTK